MKVQKLLCVSFLLINISTALLGEEYCYYDLQPCLCADKKTPGYCTPGTTGKLYCHCEHIRIDDTEETISSPKSASLTEEDLYTDETI